MPCCERSTHGDDTPTVLTEREVAPDVAWQKHLAGRGDDVREEELQEVLARGGQLARAVVRARRQLADLDAVALRPQLEVAVVRQQHLRAVSPNPKS